MFAESAAAAASWLLGCGTAGWTARPALQSCVLTLPLRLATGWCGAPASGGSFICSPSMASSSGESRVDLWCILMPVNMRTCGQSSGACRQWAKPYSSSTPFCWLVHRRSALAVSSCTAPMCSSEDCIMMGLRTSFTFATIGLQGASHRPSWGTRLSSQKRVRLCL